MKLLLLLAPDTGTEVTCSHEVTEEEMVQRVDLIMEGLNGVKEHLSRCFRQPRISLAIYRNCAEAYKRKLAIPYSEVTGVVSFYSFFSTVPRGKNLVRVCMALPAMSAEARMCWMD